jgi:hypothetical protein
MKITIDLEYAAIKSQLFRFISPVIEWITKNGDLLAHIIAIFHFMLTGMLITLILISHTIYTSVWLKLFVFVFLFIIWAQHVIFDACILTVCEKSLTQTESPFHSILKPGLALVGLTMNDYNTYLIITETIAVGCFGLELISHLSDTLLNTYKQSIKITFF